MSYLLKGVNRWHWLAAIALAFGFFLVGLDRAPVPTVDGAVRASMARHIVRTGELWPIYYDGRVFTDHPPLYLWLTAAAYKIFGVTDFGANFVPRLSAFLTVLLTALIAFESGLGAGAALASVLILCLTRDFVLSSVRGYIEPVLELFIYLGLYLTILQKRARTLWPAAAAGIAVWLAAYSKGPVALWPFLFYLFLLAWNGQTARRRTQMGLAFFGAFLSCSIVWAVWVSARGDWAHWHNYLFGQVLSSALDGRGGAQQLEPLYFATILLKYYWPWLPLLIWALYRSTASVLSLEFSRQASYSYVFLLLAAGFIGGFSIMKWKYWYYIAPAYPALALFIATTLSDRYLLLFDRPGFARGVFVIAASWCLVGSVVPIQLHRERVPEVMAFRETIRNSPLTGPVWFASNPRDHNMIGTSGEWYFDRPVTKVTAEIERDQQGNPLSVSEDSWLRQELKSPAWIITGSGFFSSCSLNWCRRSRLIQSVGESALVLYE